MQFPKSRHHRNEDDRILPLANVVFLLLIFFMLAGRLSSPDTMGILPPRSISDEPAATAGLLIQVNTQGSIAVDGDITAPARLGAAVSRFHASHPDGEVRLKADGLTDTSRVVAVMRVLRESGIEHVRLLTKRPD